jgi:hypothetical protein
VVLLQDTAVEVIAMLQAAEVVVVDMAVLEVDEAGSMEDMEDAEAVQEDMVDEADMADEEDMADRDVMDLEDLEVDTDRDLRLVDLTAITTVGRTTVLSVDDPPHTVRDLDPGPDQGRPSVNPEVEVSPVQGRDLGRIAAALAEVGAEVLVQAKGGDRILEVCPGAGVGVGVR